MGKAVGETPLLFAYSVSIIGKANRVKEGIP